MERRFRPKLFGRAADQIPASVGMAASHTTANWLRLREYFGENDARRLDSTYSFGFSANKQWGEVFSFQCSVFSRRRRIRAVRGNGSTTMTRKRCTGKGLAERRRRAMRLHLAEFAQEEIADKLGDTAPSFAAI